MAPAITLEQAQQNLADAMEALAASRKQQGYSVTSTTGGRTTNRALHQSLLEEVKFWERRVAQLQRGGIRVRGGTPV